MNKFETNVRENTRTKTAGFEPETAFGFPVTFTPNSSGVFNIYLFGTIYDPRQFINAIEVLQAAGEDDVVIINLSTCGGDLDSTDTFLSAMEECAARIVIKASGGVHSAGSVILMHADEFYLSENFNCLVHNGSCGAGGKFSDFMAQARHTNNYMQTVMRRTYAGFLTDAELNAMIEGKDFWFDAEEFMKRFDNRQKLLEGLVEQAKAEAAAPAKKPRKVKTTT